jgi:hypothetical protein
MQIGDLHPGLALWNDITLNETVFSVRSSNVFGANKIEFWKDLSDYSIYSLKHLKNIGRKTILEILSKCIIKSVSKPIPTTLKPNPHNPLSAQESNLWLNDMKLISEFLSEIALWASYETKSKTLGDIFNVHPNIELPNDLNIYLSSILNLRIDRYGTNETDSLFFDSVEKLLMLFKPIWRNILESRILTFEPLSLSDIGLSLGLTRERIRQIQSKAKDLLDTSLHDPTYFLLKWRAHSLKEELGYFAPLDNKRTQAILSNIVRDIPITEKNIASSLLLYIAGPYILKYGWLCVQKMDLPSIKDLDNNISDLGIISQNDISDWLIKLGMDQSYLDTWIFDYSGSIKIQDKIILKHKNIIDKCVAILSILGSPMTIRDLLIESGETANCNSVKNRFFDDDRLIRVNKNQWALKNWGLEEYSGIVDAIERSIKNNSGEISLTVLIEELAPLYNISEQSIRACVFR